MFWAAVFVLSFLYRFVRLIVNRVAVANFRPIVPPKYAALTSKDVTIVIPTLNGEGDELRQTVSSILATDPREIILVTIEANIARARVMVNDLKAANLRVLSVPHPNKRIQMAKAIPEIATEVTVFADDDVIWPSTLLPWMLAPLEDPNYGGVGTCQRVQRAPSPSLRQRTWAYLNCLYLERRNFDCAACSHMDGGLPCLSGRTVAYRTSILRDANFIAELKNEVWLGRYQLSVDDDNFITRWLVNHRHKIAFQWHPEAEVLTTLEDNSMYLKQCLRWSRSNWRSNITSMFVDGDIWSQQPWSTYAVHLTTLSHWALVWDAWLIYSYLAAFETSWSQYQRYEWAAFVGLLTWMFLSKFIKFTSHYSRYPLDLVLVPVSIGFGYFHGLIKLYALCTLTATTWGSRQGADAMDSYRMMRVTPDEPRCVEKLMAESAPSPLDAVTIDRRWRTNAAPYTPSTSSSSDPSRRGSPALFDVDEKPCSRTSSSNALPLMASQPAFSKASLMCWGSEKPPSYMASEGGVRVYEVEVSTP